MNEENRRLISGIGTPHYPKNNMGTFSDMLVILCDLQTFLNMNVADLI
jgi:hypothetical protein